MASDLPHNYSPPARRNSARQQAQNKTMLPSPTYLKIERDFALSPEQPLQATPDYTTSFCTADTPFDSSASMASPNDSGQAAYMTPQSQAGSLWGAAARTQASGDELDNHALHRSPSAAAFPSHVCSNQSSPRSWGSQDQFRPVSWDSAARESHIVGFVHQSPPPLPSSSSSNTSYPSGNPYLTSPFDMYQPLPDEFVSEPRCGSSLAYKAEPEDDPEDYPEDDNTPDRENNDQCQDEEVKAESPAGGRVLGKYKGDTTRSLSSSPGADTGPENNTSASSSAAAAKPRESYAQLIYQAFLTSERHAMTLKEIYQWFLENTSRAQSGTKGWQNSIRHNLSMNQAFRRRDIPPSEAPDDQDADSPHAGTPGAPDASALTNKRPSSSKKPYSEWVLEPWALRDGVQSTTRYRKGPARRHSAAASRSSLGRASKKSHQHVGSRYGTISSGPGVSRSRHKKYTKYTTTGNLYRGAAAASVSGATFPSHYLPQNHYLLVTSPPQSHDLVGSPGTSTGPAVTSAPTYLDYAPYSHTHHPHHSHHPSQHHYAHGSGPSQAMARTHSLSLSLSESGVDEPVTPEPYGVPLPLPDLRLGLSTTTNGLGGYLAAPPGAGIEADLYGFPHHHQPVTQTPSHVQTMGLSYDGLIERYGRWGEATAQGPGQGLGQDQGRQGGQFHGQY